MTAKDILERHPQELVSIGPDATVYEAIRLMAEKAVGSVLVFEGDRLAGILSERDYARKVILMGRASRETRVREIMTTEVVSVRPETSLNECLKIMTDRKIRHLPVMRGDAVLAVISILQVVKALLVEQEFTISQLQNYIAAG
jgi:CBS domain-containing protein